jgi:hypothetical protein
MPSDKSEGLEDQEVQSTEGERGPVQQMPELIYHVTPDANAIMGSKQFLPASKLAEDQQVLGSGSVTDAVSFTTLSNAENYQEGLEIYRHAARGAYDWNDKSERYSICEYYGLNYKTYEEIMSQVEDWIRRSGSSDPQKLWYEFMQKVSFYSFLHARKTKSHRWLPLVLSGGSFSPRLVQSPGIAILAISPRAGHGKSGPQKVKWASSEHEWKVYDPENFDYSTLQVVSHGLD